GEIHHGGARSERDRNARRTGDEKPTSAPECRDAASPTASGSSPTSGPGPSDGAVAGRDFRGRAEGGEAASLPGRCVGAHDEGLGDREEGARCRTERERNPQDA